MEFLAVIVGLWFWIGFFSTPYFWWKKTDRSEAPIVRRFKAFGHGLTWPYLMYKHFAGDPKADARAREREERANRIMGNGAPYSGAAATPPPASTPVSPPPVPRSPQSSSRIANPFDQR